MTNTFNINSLFEEVERFNCLQMEYKEQTLAEIITKYDFIVGSIECKDRLKGILPEGANIVCSPYIESPTTIYAIKRFDTGDLTMATLAESETETWKGYHRNITAPKGTFDKIFNEAKEDDDDI